MVVAARKSTHPATAEEVEIGFLDGNVRTGKIERFVPTMPDLMVDLDRFGRSSVAAEHVAYIAFYRDLGPSASAPPEVAAPPLRVYVAGGKVFLVSVSPVALGSNLGFRGRPTSSTSPFKEIYFYVHGINSRETATPIGKMLVESGLVGRQSLRRAVGTQAANRTIPLGQIMVERGELDADDVASAMHLQARRKLRIGQVLVEMGLTTEAAVNRALAEQKKRKGKRLGEVLVEMGVVPELDLTLTLGKKFQLRVVDLEEHSIDESAAEQIPREVIAKYGVLPIEFTSTRLVLAVSDPLGVDAIDAARRHVKRRIDEVLVVPSQLKRFVDAHLAKTPPEAHLDGRELDGLLAALREDDALASAKSDDEVDDSYDAYASDDDGIVKVVNQIIVDAHRRNASDIHIEPNSDERGLAIRFRIDGECYLYRDAPARYRGQILARIKIMAGLDIAECRKPQDGKIRFRIGDRLIELRVMTMPTVNRNEDAVLRILASSKPLPLAQIGLSERNYRDVEHAVRQPYGLVLIVGPTGSGKTTTLHSALGAINTPDRKIWTAEDPVEITQAGLRQVQLNAKIGLTFASCMRSFLRADPDVIMVGEMRDHETASMAVEASLTGHLVMSTLHTNSAPETITRLLDMGLDPFSFSDSLVAIVAQRLARSLCTKCRTQEPGTSEDFAQLTRAYDVEALATTFGIVAAGGFLVWRTKGCKACDGTGYKGRLAFHEVLTSNAEIRKLVAQKAPVGEIRRAAASNGMTTLLQDGVAKAIAGQTDMKQVLATVSSE